MPTPAQRLIHAVRSRNYQRLRQLISDGSDVSSRSVAGRTALHAAAEEGDAEAAKILIAAGADVNARMQYGQTPLHLAVAYGGGWDLADPDLDRRDPCTRGRNRSLHPKVADVLMELIKEKHPSIPSDLKPDDTIPEENKADAFVAALEFLTEPDVLLKEIVSRGIDLDKVDPDFAERLRGNPRFLEVVKVLLDHGADIGAVDDHGTPVLRGAAELGTADMVKLLLERGANPNPQRAADQSPESLIARALDYGKTEVAKALLSGGAKFAADDFHLLHEAASNARENVVVWLLDHGMDINARNEAQGNTPLLAACGHDEIVRLLIARGADVFARNDSGAGLLHLSAPWPKCLELVLPLKLPVNETDNEGRTPLHAASDGGSVVSIRALVAAGASVNAQDQAGNTPLHNAFSKEELRPDVEFPTFQALIAAGADRSIKNNEGKTVFDLAREWKYPEEYHRLLDPALNTAAGSFILVSDEHNADFLPKAMFRVELDGAEWPSAKHYFTAQKTADQELREKIRSAKTVDAAVSRFREAKAKPPANWPGRCDAVMHSALIAKFRQHDALRKQLLATGDTTLVCDSQGEWYWLEYPGVEFNAIGRMLGRIRGKLRVDS